MLVSLGMIWTRKLLPLYRAKLVLLKMKLWPMIVTVNRLIRHFLRVKQPMRSELVAQPARAKSVVIRVKADGTRSVCVQLPEMAVPSHSLHVRDDGKVIYLNTTEGSLIQFDPETDHILSRLSLTEGFLRGITKLSDTTVIAGSKGELIVADLSDQQVVDRFVFSDDPNESVFDVKVMPPEFALLPDRLRVATSP